MPNTLIPVNMPNTLIPDDEDFWAVPQRNNDAALAASRSLSSITVAPELSGRGAVGPQVASRSKSRKKS